MWIVGNICIKNIYKQDNHDDNIIYKLFNSMKQNLKIFILAFIFIFHCNTVFVDITSQAFCLTLQRIKGAQYKLFYQSISEKSTISATIQGKHIQQVVLSGHVNQTIFNATQDLYVCFKTQGSTEAVSIDFYPTEQQKYKQLALKSQVQQVHQQLILVGMKLRQITHHQQFEEQRQAIQSQIIQKHEKKIYIYSLIKVGLVLLVIVAQIILLKRKIGSERIKQFFNF